MSATSNPRPRFPVGQTVATPGALASVPIEEMLQALSRHVCGDWGDLEAHDKAANESALKNGGRLFSAYHTASGIKFWIITEADRSATTTLLPREY